MALGRGHSKKLMAVTVWLWCESAITLWICKPHPCS